MDTKDKDFDIDEVLKDAVEEDEKQTKLEAAEAEIEKQKKEIADLKAQKEQLKPEEKENKGKGGEEEEGTEKVTIENLAEQVTKITQNNEQEAIRRVDSGLIKLTGDLPDLMNDEDVLNSPALVGSPVTVKQYLEGILSVGGYEQASQAAKEIMRGKGIKVPKISETLPRGTNVGGEGDNEDSERITKKKKNVNELLNLMATGKLASKVAKAKNSQV